MSRRVVEDRELARLIKEAVAEAFAKEREARKKRDQAHKNNITSIALRVRESPKEGYASIAEFAKCLGVGRTVISRLVKEGVIASVQVGTRLRIPWSELKSPKLLRGPE